jgi:ribonucleotide reductase beta subunit family protein with ferritin-like domain
MEDIIYMHTLVQRGSRYFIRIIHRDEAYYVTLTSDTGEQIREQLIPDLEFDSKNFSAADTFREIIEDEARWVADNR